MTDPAWQVRRETGSLVRRLVRTAGGQFASRPLLRSDPAGRKTSEPVPLAGITAAVAVGREARRLELESVRNAREDGLSWREIGEAMGFAGSSQPCPVSAAGHAFQRAVPGHAAADYFPWTCPSCGRLIRDYGPETGPPETEAGHAGGCERLAATVRAWDAQWEEGSGE